MSRHRANALNIRPLGDGFQLYGWFLGKRIRERSQELAYLLRRKAELEIQRLKLADALAEPRLARTRLTDAQILDSEAAIEIGLDGHSFVDWVREGKRLGVFPSSEPVTCSAAVEAYLKQLKGRKRSKPTLDKNRLRLAGFLKFTRLKRLSEITPAVVETWVYRPGGADYTRITDAQVLRAFLNFCAGRSRRWFAESPFEIDMKDMTATAKPKEPGRLLTPEQCHAYLNAALSYRGTKQLTAYVILTTWLFMRESEARRVTKADFRFDAVPPVVRAAGAKRGTAKLRVVTIPDNVLPLLQDAVKNWAAHKPVPFSRHGWATIREAAGLLRRGKTTRNKRRKIVASTWQRDIARHSGISYLYQKTGDIRDVCRQAGNTSDVSFRHYLTLPESGDAARFYAPVTR